MYEMIGKQQWKAPRFCRFDLVARSRALFMSYLATSEQKIIFDREWKKMISLAKTKLLKANDLKTSDKKIFQKQVLAIAGVRFLVISTRFQRI